MAAVRRARAARSRRRIPWILPLIFGSGVVSFSYEVLWVRLLEHVLGGSVYAFATMLASFLAGIALGSALASRLGIDAAARDARLRDRAAVHRRALAGRLRWSSAGSPSSPPRCGTAASPQLLVDAVASMLTLFPAAVAIGATFPFAVRVLARREADAGPVSARVYAANTLGSIVGADRRWLLPGSRVGLRRDARRLRGGQPRCWPGRPPCSSRPRRPALALAACAGLVLLGLGAAGDAVDDSRRTPR